MRNPVKLIKEGVEYCVDRYLERKGRPKMADELEALSGGKRGSVRDYYVRKAEIVLAVTVITALICIPAAIITRPSVTQISDGKVTRPDYLMGDVEEKLTVHAEGESEDTQIAFSVPSREYSAKEVRAYLKSASMELNRVILGENTSRDEVRYPLVFPETLEEGKVSAAYMTMPYGIIDETGKIVGSPMRDGSVVELQVTLTCQGKNQIVEEAFCVYPPIQTMKESFLAQIREDVDASGRRGRQKSYMQLPQQVNGKKLSWYARKKGWTGLFLLLLLAVPAGVYFRKDQMILDKAKERQYQLGLDYSDLMWKISMLLGAGLSIRGALYAVASDYRKVRSRRPRYAGEEVLYTCYELQSGVSEPEAYAHFGRRCGRPEYIKLSGILAQNMKKGSAGLAAALEKEAVTAMENRRCSARKIGEQAGTKVLFPMILMFMVVIAVLILPAFMSM